MTEEKVEFKNLFTNGEYDFIPEDEESSYKKNSTKCTYGDFNNYD